MDYINISHKRIHSATVHSFSSELNAMKSADNVLNGTGSWSTTRRDIVINEYIILDYGKNVLVDFIELAPVAGEETGFPGGFRIESSNDMSSWRIVHAEKNIDLESGSCRIDIPATRFRYLKILITDPCFKDGKYYSEIGSLCAGISGIHKITASSVSGADARPENLLEDNMKTFWQSELKAAGTKESLLVDLGRIVHINRILMGSTGVGFPEDFFVETSTDNSVWTTLFQEKGFRSEYYKKYFWDLKVTPARYIRIEATGIQVRSGQYAVQIAELEISGAPFDPYHSHNIGDLTPYSSIFQAGIVKLAKDGQDTSGTAVQGSDRRLRDATTIFKGIVQLADDREDQKGLVVQASDSRLKPATDLHAGIVRLGYDKETTPCTAVQGSDSRLREASEENPGIFKLCPDGAYTENGVVRGNDTRIRRATTGSHGIIRLAENGESAAGAVVQSDDSRLRDAGTTYKGIVELAEDGEDSEGVAVQGNDRRLRDATTMLKGIVELAEDGEESDGVVVQGSDRRLKHATTKTKGIVELAEDGEERPGVVVQGNDRRLREATTKSKGIVELAEDGEDADGVAVQGNDRRLREATITSKGIVELAEDGEDADGVAVQGSDRRLREATTKSKGIVELAEDGEDADGVAVQGSDRRLREATTKSKGIVELAEDGEERPGVAVQGNDSRLRHAGEDDRGIMLFAKDGDTAPFAAVQGSDSRLRHATTMSKGIVELAEDGEDADGVAVQGSDRRLREATTKSKGIVELAEDGEERPGVAVQGNDSRLKKATEKRYGITKLAKNNESRAGIAVQSNDSRLSDAREPLAHEHEYAPLEHDFNSHSGTINIRSRKNEVFKELVPPSGGSSIIHAANDSDRPCAIGVSGVAGPAGEGTVQSYGVLGHSCHVGVRGQSTGSSEAGGCGVLGLSRFGAGGVFCSEHAYSVVADGFGNINDHDSSVNLIGNGDALLVNGRSVFDGRISISNSRGDRDFPVNFAELFEVDEESYVSAGDILVVSESGASVLTRSSVEYSTGVIGIVSGNPTVVINNSGTDQKVYPVALAGSALCKIDARKGPVNPGDLIVTSDTPGCGMAGTIDSFSKVGSVIGKALDRLDDGIGVIPVFITRG